MNHSDFYATYDDLVFWLIWVPISVPFLAVFLISAAVVLPIAFVGNLLYRGFDALRDQYRGSRA